MVSGCRRARAVFLLESKVATLCCEFSVVLKVLFFISHRGARDQTRAAASGVASRKIGGGKYFYFQRTTVFDLGTAPLEALNNKIC